MYLSYYGFDRAPFDPAPQPDTLFETATHNEALAGLVYGILDRKGFIALLGEVGVGKTTVLRRALHYVAAHEPKLLIIDVTNPAIGPVALAARLHRALEVAFDPTRETDLAPLRAELTYRAAAGERLLLVIDEAQSVPSSTLEFLRILSNLDGGGQPLIQVVFCGQPEFDATLHSPAQRALAQRLAVRTHIRPLTRREVAAYLDFKLMANGVSPRGVMRRSAIRRIAAASGGFPRRVNIIADNALIAGFGADRKPIGRREVADALRSLEVPRPRRPLRRLAWRVGFTAAAALVAVGLIVWPGLLPTLASHPAPSPGDAKAVEPLAAMPARAIPAVVAPPPASPQTPTPALAPREAAQPASSIVQTAVLPLEPRAEMIPHEVRRGDTVTGILRGHALPTDPPSLQRLREVNPEITNLNLLTPGQRILLPTEAAPTDRSNPRAP